MFGLFLIGALALSAFTALTPQEWKELADKMEG